MRNKLVFQNGEIEIYYKFNKTLNDADIDEFYCWLGDNDIVTAYEIDDFLCAAGILYKFGELESNLLMRYGNVKLHKVESLKNYIRRNNCENNVNYYKWYYNLI